MVFTDSVIAFAHVGAEKMLDVVPMNDIINIQDCDGVNEAETDDKAGRVLLEIEWKVCGKQPRTYVCACVYICMHIYQALIR
jgi:hypothetical protein